MWLGLGIKIVNWLRAVGPSGPFGGHATLTDNLVTYWTLDEASGVREDSVGPNDLTDNNTVGSATGVNNLAASFVAANSEYLSLAGPIPAAEQDFSISAWIKPTSATLRVIFNSAHGGGGGGAGHWQAYRSNGNKLVLGADGSGDVGGTATIDGTSWVSVILVYTTSDKTLKSYVNSILDATAVGTGGGVYTATDTFRIGAQTSGSFPYDGLMDEIGLWSRVLTAQERTDLYNGGAGLFYGS